MTDDPSIVEPLGAEATGVEATEVDSSDVPAPSRHGFSLWPSLILAATWVLVDQASKHWAVNELNDRNIDLVGSLRFNLHFNSGMAFGRGTGLGPVIGIVAILVVVALLTSLRRAESRTSAVGVGLVIGGALGNVIDRLFRGERWFRGAVVDFIDLQWFPIFNVADIGINIGAALLVLGALFAGRHVRVAPASTVR